ncbi:MAG: RluA family pseudouridine synthase [Butyrivibrio sp.]|nr:RluA family pseudouridine synthase [Butyrivibrio sp.]
MYARTVTANEEGQRFDRYLHKLLPKAGNSFIYKMLRKKNIVLNSAKADGSEKLRAGDTVQVYFSDETLEKFMGTRQKNYTEPVGKMPKHTYNLPIIYENEHILIADKPAGLLSQKAKADDFSLNDWLIQYLLENGNITEESLKTFRPSVCNRLDRNTSGIVLCAKSVRGAQMLGNALKERGIRKFYRLYVKGSITEEKTIEGYLIKNEKNNKVQIRSDSVEKASYIKTKYAPIKQYGDKTLLEVELITGKSHQIRAHLAGIGHPVLGDYKYGNRAWNDKYRARYGVKYQLLHAYKVVFPQLGEPFGDISGREFTAPLPEIFDKVTDI